MNLLKIMNKKINEFTKGNFDMNNKYKMTKEDNIFFAKRKLIDNIYKSANLEGIAVTFADIYSFINKDSC